MSSTIPTTTAVYNVDFSVGDFSGLRLQESVSLPASLGPHDCLVAIRAVSLNYRDIAMVTGVYPQPTKKTVVPCSDGAGTVLKVGNQVTSLQVGDQVCPCFFQDFEDGVPTKEQKKSSLGGLNDGVLRKYAVFPERGLVKLPRPNCLSMREASTLPCAALTAWNSLFGLEGRKLKEGDWVLTQGTGGVSLFAILFAKAIGAKVVATTGDAKKENRLREMGVDEVINYKQDPQWGETARTVIEKAGGTGAQHIIEVGGETTLAQSFKAVAIEGVISIVGFLGGWSKDEEKASFSGAFATNSIVRGMFVGSKRQFEDMLVFIDERKIRPPVDEKVFTFEQAKEAYECLKSQKFFGKVVIDLSD